MKTTTTSETELGRHESFRGSTLHFVLVRFARADGSTGESLVIRRFVEGRALDASLSPRALVDFERAIAKYRGLPPAPEPLPTSAPRYVNGSCRGRTAPRMNGDASASSGRGVGPRARQRGDSGQDGAS